MLPLYSRILATAGLGTLLFVQIACAPQRQVVKPTSEAPRQITPSDAKSPFETTSSKANSWFYRHAEQTAAPSMPAVKEGTFIHEHVNPVKVALLVPLSGKFSSIGQQMLQAAQLALFTAGNTRVTVMPYDTQGDPYVAVRAFRDAQQQGTDIILGPLFSSAAKAIAAPARAANIPIISFSNNSTLANDGIFVFGKLPETQYKTLANYALSQQIKTFTFLGPNDAYGAKALDAARISLQSNGHKLQRVELYRKDVSVSPDRMAKHISSAVQPLHTQHDDANAAMFIAETSPRRIAAVADQWNNLPDVTDHIQILGDSAWLKKADNAIKRILKGALIAATEASVYHVFEKDFHDAYNTFPTELSSLAYDGVLLMIHLATIHDSGKIQKDMLLNAPVFKGAQGQFRFSSKRMVERNLAVYRMNGTGGLTLLAPARRDF